MHTHTPIIRSLLDIDFYKFTMGQFIHRLYPDIEVTFTLINRDKDIPLAHIIPEEVLRRELDSVRTLRFTDEDIRFLRETDAYGQNLFSESYLSFLKEDFVLPPYMLTREGSQYRLSFTGHWKTVTFWETVALAIVSELYTTSLLHTRTPKERADIYRSAHERLVAKLTDIARIPTLRFADFGQRRRHSAAWQRHVIRECLKRVPSQFIGTSNTLLAKELGIRPVGTNAHELPMILTAIADPRDKARVQYDVVERWGGFYGKHSEQLLMLLPDTYGTEQFLAGAPHALASMWKGFRQDSGNPERSAHMYIDWLRRHGVHPKEKVIIFSDGLDVSDMKKLHDMFIKDIGVAFGWGTLLTNDFVGISSVLPELRPFSLVCKATSANQLPVVKLSDNINKATGTLFEIEKYLTLFGRHGREHLPTIV